MNSLKNFIINEEIRISHAEKYLSFIDKYHGDVYIDLKREVEKLWTGEVEKLKKKYPLSSEAIEDVLLRNERGTIDLELSSRQEKILSLRSGTHLESSISVKIPRAYDFHERQVITKDLLKTGLEAIKNVANSWKKVLYFETKGQLRPWFKIIEDGDEVRFQLMMGSAENAAFKTLYSIRVEYGKTKSKLKDFDRVYLTSLV